MNEYLKKKNVEMFCCYIANMDCKRKMTVCDVYQKESYDYDVRASDRENKKDGKVRNAIEPILHFYGFIILKEYRKENVIVSGFMTYRDNIVKLTGGQTKNIFTVIAGEEVKENYIFTESTCSISLFRSIESDVMNDEDVIEKDLLLKQ